jgi:thiol-disulfide isomerase/thioredoxin
MKTALLLLLGLALARPTLADLKPGEPFPALGSYALTGAAVPDCRGKVTIVDFCASWCAPCKASFAVYDRLAAAYGPRGLTIVAVSVDQNESDYRRFVRRLRPSFPVLDDAGQKLVARVAVPTMPTSYLLDRTGRVRFVHAGFHGAATERQLKSEIETLLKETPPAS